MGDDLRTGLLTRRSGMDKYYEQCTIRIQRVRQKNDVIQRQIGTDIEDTIRTEVNNQKKFIEKQITELKDLLVQMQNKFRDPESKNKIKQLKTDAHKQIDRNKVILKDLITKSFAARSMGRPQDHDNGQNYMEGGKIDYNNLDHNKIVEDQDENKASMITDQAIEIDYQLERKILIEKGEMINEVEQQALRINEIINDTGLMVEQQGQNLDIISEQLVKTHENVVVTNKNLEKASHLQKKSRKKYVIWVMIILIVIVIVAGIVFFLTQ